MSGAEENITEMQIEREQPAEETVLQEEEPISRKRKIEDTEDTFTDSFEETEPATEIVPNGNEEIATDAPAIPTDPSPKKETMNDSETKNEEEITTDAPAEKQEADVSNEEENDHENEAVTESSIPSSPRKQGSCEYDKLKWIVVRNDGKPESMIKLIGLKSLFAKQLPKMPRSYIARLVLDRRHTSLAILQDKPELKNTDDEIVGAICYRAFREMRFAEIAFCAVNANHQVKGYGSKLMNLFKNHAVQEGIEYFITYADNYAIGYFKKQGFSKTISMPKGRYSGLIKEYDGGTPMECWV